MQHVANHPGLRSSSAYEFYLESSHRARKLHDQNALPESASIKRPIRLGVDCFGMFLEVGARLESVFRGNSNVGSNPTLSAINNRKLLVPKLNQDVILGVRVSYSSTIYLHEDFLSHTK